MENQFYQCPVCHHSLERELVGFLRHTNNHIRGMIQSRHPEWFEADGQCVKCDSFLSV